MAVNLPKIADTPYLSLYCNSTKQNDNVTMTFPVNSSLQCFRTAALSMVTLNMESRSLMGRVNAENRSKTQKPLGFKGLMASTAILCKFSFVLLPLALRIKFALRPSGRGVNNNSVEWIFCIWDGGTCLLLYIPDFDEPWLFVHNSCK